MYILRVVASTFWRVCAYRKTLFARNNEGSITMVRQIDCLEHIGLNASHCSVSLLKRYIDRQKCWRVLRNNEERSSERWCMRAGESMHCISFIVTAFPFPPLWFLVIVLPRNRLRFKRSIRSSMEIFGAISFPFS